LIDLLFGIGGYDEKLGKEKEVGNKRREN